MTKAKTKPLPAPPAISEADVLADFLRVSGRNDAGRTTEEWAALLGWSNIARVRKAISAGLAQGRMVRGYRDAVDMRGFGFRQMVFAIKRET